MFYFIWGCQLVGGGPIFLHGLVGFHCVFARGHGGVGFLCKWDVVVGDRTGVVNLSRGSIGGFGLLATRYLG